MQALLVSIAATTSVVRTKPGQVKHVAPPLSGICIALRVWECKDRFDYKMHTLRTLLILV